MSSITKSEKQVISDTRSDNTITNIIFPIMIAITAMSGTSLQWMVSFGIVACCMVLAVFKKLHFAFPFVIFYNSVYGLVLGMSVMRIYSILIIFQSIIYMPKQIQLNKVYIYPLSVYTLFVLLVMISYTTWSSLWIVIDVICCVIIISKLSKDPTDLKTFFKIYALVCLCSYITGVITENYIGDEYNYQRFNATFEDPNYMGFFFTIAVFAIVSLKLFDKRFRYSIIVVLYFMMAASLSITAIITNVVLWIFYLLLMQKINLRSAIFGIVICIVLYRLYLYGLENPDIPVLGDISARLSEKLLSFSTGNIDDATTGRTSISEYNLNYYLSLPVFNILLGGIPCNPRFVHQDLAAVSHNEFVDLLLNVGIIGAAIMIGFFAYNYFKNIMSYYRTRTENSLCMVMLKTVWLLYAFTLTMFLDFRFMFAFLI